MNRKWTEVIAVVTFFLLGTVAPAGQASTARYVNGPATGIANAPFPASTTTITESTNSASINDNVNCGGYSGSSFYRAFQLSTFPSLNLARFRLQAVTFGIWLVTSDDGLGTLPLTVNVYSSSALPPTLASLTLLDSVSFSFGGHNLHCRAAKSADHDCGNGHAGRGGVLHRQRDQQQHDLYRRK